MQRLKVVARFRNGRVVKGFVENLNTAAGGLHLFPATPQPGAAASFVGFDELKAVFVVHDFAGKPGLREKRQFDAAQKSAAGAKVRITFDDGEVMVGVSLNYDPTGQGFFLFPVDERSNNQRIYVLNAAVKDIKQVA